MGGSLKNGSSFLLSKWYLDCVSDDGSAFIAYAASLRWRGLSLNYSSMLLHRPGEASKTDTTLQEFSIPEVAGPSLRWSSARLGVAGTWESAAPSFKRTLLQSADGSIEWNCLRPRARSEISFGGRRQLEGLGYAEQLTMTIPPWRLPFEELRWGRFLSETDALVWVNWRGAHVLNLSFHNGVCVEDALVTDNEVAAGETRLTLGENTVLRDGALVETALSTIPGVRGLLPVRVLGTRESKWLSRGLLNRPGAESRTGWTIHEVVRWPNSDS